MQADLGGIFVQLLIFFNPWLSRDLDKVFFSRLSRPELAQVMVQGCLSKCQRIRIMDCCQLFEVDCICSVTNASDHLFRGVVTIKRQ